MPRTRKRRSKTSTKIRNFHENILNLIPFSPRTETLFLGFRLKNVNQLWKWDTLEDVNFK